MKIEETRGSRKENWRAIEGVRGKKKPWRKASERKKNIYLKRERELLAPREQKETGGQKTEKFPGNILRFLLTGRAGERLRDPSEKKGIRGPGGDLLEANEVPHDSEKKRTKLAERNKRAKKVSFQKKGCAPEKHRWRACKSRLAPTKQTHNNDDVKRPGIESEGRGGKKSNLGVLGGTGEQSFHETCGPRETIENRTEGQVGRTSNR